MSPLTIVRVLQLKRLNMRINSVLHNFSLVAYTDKMYDRSANQVSMERKVLMNSYRLQAENITNKSDQGGRERL